MSEKQLTAHDMELLTCAGIYVEPQALNGPALIFQMVKVEKYVCCGRAAPMRAQLI